MFKYPTFQPQINILSPGKIGKKLQPQGVN